MARYLFCGGIADWALALVEVSSTPNLAQATGGAMITFWTAETGGSQHADLLDTDGSPLTAVMSADGSGVRAVGQIPPVYGPDGVVEMWAQAGDGPRARVVAAAAAAIGELDTRVGAVESQADALGGRVNEVETGVASVGHDPSLRKWYAALAKRYASPVSIVVMGDSNSEGTGATTSYRRRWQQVLQAELRARFQPPGVTGATLPYITASPRTILIPGDYPRTVTSGVTESQYGLGSRSATVGSGQSVTFTFTGTRAKLRGFKGPGVGLYSIKLNGGAEVVVDGNAVNSDNGQLIWDSGALTAGNHTVVVARATSTTQSPGNVYVEGLMTYNGDESTGVRVIDAAKGGARVADFTGLNAWNWHLAFQAVENKGLLIMPWGANDAFFNVPATTFRSDLESLISLVRGNGFTGSILLVQMPKRGGGITEELWSSYQAQMDAVADADPDIATFNLRARMPDQGTAEATSLGLYYDEVHYNDTGQGWIADQLATAIIPR